MRIPRPRFTVRWLLVTVAIVGLFLGGWTEIGRRRERFLVIVSDHQMLLHKAIGFDKPGRTGWTIGDGTTISDRRMKWYWRQIAKYQWAADHPWLPVRADEPAPE
jgi:hypothetical protein